MKKKFLVLSIIIIIISFLFIISCSTRKVEISETVTDTALKESESDSQKSENIAEKEESIEETENISLEDANIELTSNWEEVITNEDIKIDGLTWDGKNFWVITYQSSPILWQIAKLDDDGKVSHAFQVECDSRDDIHNSGYTNLTWDNEVIWANNWNEGIIYSYNTDGEILTNFSVPSIAQLIPIGITWDGQKLWIFHWVDKTIYGLDRNGNETGDIISLKGMVPSLDMGLVWDGNNFWAGSKGGNIAMRISSDGKANGYIKGPKESGGIRDLAWDGENLYWVYQQDHTIYKTIIEQ